MTVFRFFAREILLKQFSCQLRFVTLLRDSAGESAHRIDKESLTATIQNSMTLDHAATVCELHIGTGSRRWQLSCHKLSRRYLINKLVDPFLEAINGRFVPPFQISLGLIQGPSNKSGKRQSTYHFLTSPQDVFSCSHQDARNFEDAGQPAQQLHCEERQLKQPIIIS